MTDHTRPLWADLPNGEAINGLTDADIEAARRAADDHHIVTKYYRDGEIRWQGCDTCDVEIRDYDEQERHELRAALSAIIDRALSSD